MVTAAQSGLDFLGLGNAVPVLTGGASQNPEWNPANLDPATQALIDQQTKEGQLSQQQIVDQQLAGTHSAMPSAVGGAVGQQEHSLGGADSAAVDEALNNRANRLYSEQFNQLQNQARAAAPGTQGRLMGQAANALQQQQNVNDELNRQQMAVTLQKWGMRNQIIGQLMGGAGAFAGTYAGMNGGKGANPSQGMVDAMNSPSNPSNPGNYTSDPNQRYNLTGDNQTPQSQSLGTGYENQFQAPKTGFGQPGMDGNGYYGEQWKAPGNAGYGLGVSFNGSG